MRSALRQALDILGPDADPEQLSILWSVVCDLVWKRLPKAWDDPTWAAAGGADRVRMVLAAAVDASYIADGTEPKPVLQRLGLAHLARLGPSLDDR